jgi:hypothetical protein
VSGKSPVLNIVKAVIGKTHDSTLVYLSYIRAYSLRSKEVYKVIETFDDDGNSIRAFPFGSNTKPIPSK